MDLYTGIPTILGNLPALNAWPELRQTLDRAAAKKPRNWQLPVAASRAVGGQPTHAIYAAAAIACAETSILLIDDMLDSDPRGEYWRIGMPATANLASALQAAAMEVIFLAPVAEEPKLLAVASLAEMLNTVASGQYRDGQGSLDEPTYWQIVQAKSGAFFGSALYLGAIFGGASDPLARQMKRLGHVYGEMVQIHDDLRDALLPSANSDWLPGRSTLPILYAQVAEHSERERFAALRVAAAHDPTALAEAQAILIRCGATCYGVHHLLLRQQQAQVLMRCFPVTAQAELEVLLNGLMEPVRGLFTEAGVDPSELMASCRNVQAG